MDKDKTTLVGIFNPVSKEELAKEYPSGKDYEEGDFNKPIKFIDFFDAFESDNKDE